MSLGPFLRRILNTSARSKSTWWARAITVVLMSLPVGVVVIVWDWHGWERASVSGSKQCALAAFGALIATQVILGLGIVAGAVSPGAALERDKKTLDALLATRLTSAEIVLGMLAAGLVESLNSMAPVVPLVVLTGYLGGIDPRLALLACAGVVTTLGAVGAISAVSSVAAGTAQRSLGRAMFWALIWLILPVLAVRVLPLIWAAGARWVVPPALWLLASTPLGVGANIVGLVRRTSLLGSVLWMMGLQTAGAGVLVAWAVWRLRPASRALYDGEGRAALSRLLRRRRGARPACDGDPVLWNEIHSTRGATTSELLAGWLAGAIAIGFVAYLTSWFAGPAFAELAERGYGALPGKVTMPDLHPLARVMAVKLSKFSIDPAPGQARLEFNIVLRQASAFLVMIYTLVIAGLAAEGVVAEKDRDTWLGLIATPLSGWEILRAKMIGAAWRARGFSLILAGLWIVGLLAGALHPLGFLAALIGLGATTWFFAALGTYVSLWSSNRKEATGQIMLPAMLTMVGFVPPFLPSAFGSVLMAAGSMSFLTWASVLSYEDIAAATRTGAFPQLVTVSIHTGEGAWKVLATVLIGMTAQLAGALLLTHAACRGFDVAVGRPMRPGNPPIPEDLEVTLPSPHRTEQGPCVLGTGLRG
jgi:hypothetical protein